MRSLSVVGSLFAAALSISCTADEAAPGGAGDSGTGGKSASSGGPNGGLGGAPSGGMSAGGAPSGAGGASGGVSTGGRGSPNAGGTGAKQSAGGATVSTGGKGSGGSPMMDAGDESGGSAGDSGPGGYPDETTTGPNLGKCAGGVLKKYTQAGDYRPKTGEVVSCMEFQNAAIYIPSDVSNVTIENCRFVTTQDLFVNVQGSGVTIQDSEFHGPAGTWIRNSYSGNHLTIRRNEFTGMGNAVEFNVGYETIEDNYAHDFGTADPEQHADGLQTDGTSHAVVRHNTVLLNADAAGATGAISIFDGVDVLVEKNKVAGGGYTVYPGGTNSSNVRFLDNCFSTVFYPGQSKIGVYNAWYPSNNPKDLVRTGNTWCDGPKAGQPLNDNP